MNNEEPEVVIDEVPDVEIDIGGASDPAAEANKDVEEGLDDLKRQLDEEKAQRVEADRRAREAASREANATHEVVRARSEAQDANLNLIVGAIDQINQSTKSLKERYKVAHAEGDADSLADIQIAFAENATRLQQLEQGKRAIENAPKIQQVQPRVSSDPVEALASQLSQKSADWVRRHPEFATDQKQYQRMLAAHNLAEADGLVADTPEYFDAVENTLRLKKDAYVETQPRAAQPPAAPASRQGGSISATAIKPGRVRLSSAEVEIATMMGMTPEDYARNKVALMKENRIGSVN